MTIVFPILLGGLLLAGIPVLLHLIMRQKPKTLLFPAFRFLLQRHRMNQRKLRLRHLVLLALRMLLIAAICLALARPKLFDAGLDGPVVAVLVFDTSPSMEYKAGDGKTTRLDEAKKRGLELLDELHRESKIAILTTGDASSSGVGDWVKTWDEARKRIQGLQLNPTAGAVTARLSGAYALLTALAQTKEPAAQWPRVLAVFSDRTTASWETERVGDLQVRSDQLPPLLRGLEQARGNLPALRGLLQGLRDKLPPAAQSKGYPEQGLIDDIDALVQQVSGIGPDDFPASAELTQLAGQVRRRARDILERLPDTESTPKDMLDYRAKLTAGLHQAVSDLGGMLNLFLDVGIKEPTDLAITDIELPRNLAGQERHVFAPGEVIALKVHVKATGDAFFNKVQCQIGKATYEKGVTLEAGQRDVVEFAIDTADLALPAGDHQAEIRLKVRPSLGYSFTRFVTISLQKPRRLLVLTDAASRAARLRQHAEALGFAVDVETTPPASFQPYKAIVLLSVPEPGPKLWEQLYDYVLEGNGLAIIPPDEKGKIEAYNHPLAQKLLPGRLGRIIEAGDARAGDGGAPWDWSDASVYTHALLRRFHVWRHDKKVDFIANPPRAFFYWQIDDVPKDAAVRIRYEDDARRPALLERKIADVKGAHGPIVLLTTRMDYGAPPDWNTYAQTSFYLVLTAQLTGYLVGNPEEARLNFLCGEDPVIRLPLTPRFSSYNLRGAGRHIPLHVAKQQTEVELKQPLNSVEVLGPGNYSIEGVEGTGTVRLASFSINLPPRETDLTQVPAAPIEALFGPTSVIRTRGDKKLTESLEGRWSHPIELFPFLMVVLLLFLAVENLLANKFYKREPAAEEKTAGA